MEPEKYIYDCIIIGAGPGGLQAAIYLGRFNMDILLIDRGGGRTHHARHIRNFLTQAAIPGKDIIRLGIEQAESFNVKILQGTAVKILKKEYFEVFTEDSSYFARFVIVSSGVKDNFPSIENLHKFLGISFFTCLDCDGYETTGKKLIIIGNHIKSVHLAVAMKEMFTKDITLVIYTDIVPEIYKEELADENIPLITGRPVRIIGDDKIEALELSDGRVLECEVIMSHFGYKLNDKFLAGLDLKKDRDNLKYAVSTQYESSLNGLYIVGPLNTGNDQAVIAAGEGATAAIDIMKRLLDM